MWPMLGHVGSIMPFIPLLIMANLLSTPADEPVRVDSLTGHIVRLASFKSEVLGNSRNLTIYLPPGYDQDKRKRYPVLYLHDGQNVFSGLTSYIPNKEWRLDESAEALIRAKLIEPIIMVGIDNGQGERANEYLPTSFAAPWGGEKIGGKADLYAKMLLEEIKPMIDKTYRTKPDATNTALMGSSFGGVATLYLGLTHPDKFSRLGVVSPSLWVDHGVMLKKLRDLKTKLPLKIWLDMGATEGGEPKEDAQTVAQAVEAGEILISKGWKAGKDLSVYIEGYASHNEDAWARRSPAILMFLFGR